MADYLSRFPSAAAPERSYYDESFTVTKLQMINNALKPRDIIIPRGQKVKQIRKKPTVEGGRSCLYAKRTIVTIEKSRKPKYANNNRERTRSLEGVVTCNRRLANQTADICIPKEMCKLQNKKIRRCSQSVKSSYLFNQNSTSNKNKSTKNSPEKQDPKPLSTIVNTSTQSGNVNLNLVVNRVQGQPPSLSSDSDIEVIPPEKVVPKNNSTKKLNTLISFPHQFPGLFYPL